MFYFTFLFVLCCTLAEFHMALGASIDKTDGSTIQAIFSMFRHGDRSPIYFWPNDPYLNYKWPGGFGSLSDKGVGQLYNLGRNLKHRYGHLLPVDGRYSQDNMLVKSSYSERCIMSGLSLLAGFMPPNSNPLPIKWQPIPITTIPQYDDELLSQYRPCKKYDKLYEDLLVNAPADLMKLEQENEDVFKLAEQSGRKNIKYTDIGEFYDTLKIYKDNGLNLPEWAKEIFPEKMRPFAERTYSVYTETPYMKKVKGGAFITEVYKKMVSKQAKTLSPERKMFLYASHDSTIIGILNALDILDQAARLPDYAAMLVFELHTNKALENDLEVKIVYYSNSAIVEPKELHLPSCSSPCSLTKFGEAVNDLLIDDYDKLCENV
uniref:Venom polypeptide n=1 Tax=Dolopus genitalis TaxID=2488630 RepID=A0A3G5BIL7_DOLGE|nr:venom polypeptide [Dolopus genitalis]